MTRRTGSALTVAIVGWLGLILAGTEARAQGRVPNFPLGVAIPDGSGQNGLFWLGGDSPFGTYIAPEVSFWAFGDTFLSSPGVNSRQLSSVVANTIAIGLIVDGKFTPKYFYKGSAANKQAFFPNPDGSHKFWPKASAMIGGKLFVFLTLELVNLTVPLGDSGGAIETGVLVARVDNPTDIPTIWRVDYLTMHIEDPGRQANLKLGIEVLPSHGAVDGLVVYGFFNNAATRTNKSIVLLVSNRTLLTTPGGYAIDPGQFQYLAADPGNVNPHWKPGKGPYSGGPDDYLDTEIDSVSGYTVRWNAMLGRWQVVGANSQYAALYPYPAGSAYTPLPFARIFTHPSPFGPFIRSPQASNCYFYKFSDLDSPDRTLVCYTARQWQDPLDPAYNTDAHLLLTYTYSSMVVQDQERNPNLYQTHQVLLPNPYTGPPGTLTPCAAPPLTGLNPPPKAATPDPFAAPGTPRPLPFPR